MIIGKAQPMEGCLMYSACLATEAKKKKKKAEMNSCLNTSFGREGNLFLIVTRFFVYEN